MTGSLLYSRNRHNIVNQLYFIKNIFLKNWSFWLFWGKDFWDFCFVLGSFFFFFKESKCLLLKIILCHCAIFWIPSKHWALKPGQYRREWRGIFESKDPWKLTEESFWQIKVVYWVRVCGYGWTILIRDCFPVRPAHLSPPALKPAVPVIVFAAWEWYLRSSILSVSDTVF